MSKNDAMKTLIYKRGILKGQLTSFKKYLEKFTSENITESDLQNIKARLDKIEIAYTKFDEVQSDIELALLTLGEQLDDERDAFENEFFNVVSQANLLVSKDDSKKNTSGSELNQANDAISQAQSIQKLNVKLPQIQLPQFSGEFTQWREFFDAFKSLIHNNVQLPDVQKLSYLKSSLKGEPANLVRSFQTTEENYEIVWSLLQKRYNNTRRIIDNHVQALLGIPKVQRESYVTLRQLINSVENHIQCLRALNQPTESWDVLIIPIIAAKLDAQTGKEWESKLNEDNDNEKLPTLKEFLEFLSSKQNTLEALFMRKTDADYKHVVSQKTKNNLNTFTVTNISCSVCDKEHAIQNCEIFNKLNQDEKNVKVRELKLCINCLRKNHFVQNCMSKSTCRKCNKKHHTLLHKSNETANAKTEGNSMKTVVFKSDENIRHAPDKTDVTTTTCSSEVATDVTQVLLSTAVVYAEDEQGNYNKVRLLLDSASMSNFITQPMCDKLKLNTEPISVNVAGINNEITPIKQKTQVKIKSVYSDYSLTVSCLVLPRITTGLMPQHHIRAKHLNIPSGIKLADPNFNTPGEIDMLIGAQLFWELLCVGQIKQKHSPTFNKTKFGWIASGQVKNMNKNKNPVSLLSLTDLHQSVEKFWQYDEFTSKVPSLTKEEQHCEDYFTKTTSRDEQGKFIVRIPFKDNVSLLGDSKQSAESRFLKLEKRFENDVKLKESYTNFMHEYINLNHMTKINPDDKQSFYLPHHPVLKDSETTAVRVVFDGSCRLENGLNINEVQCTGPTIQNDLFSIVARFRTFTYVVTADVEKMYRQVWVHPDDRPFQRIVWRSDPSEDLQYYELNTVTYGLTSSPFLAIRSLHQLGIENGDRYPVESEVIKNNMYVDDLLTGHNSAKGLQEIVKNVCDILQSGGFNLRKLRSNKKCLFDSESCKEITNQNLDVLANDVVYKTLGIYWNPEKDVFIYPLSKFNKSQRVTKRSILAITSQLFDPLGLLAPVIVTAKFIIQELWQLQIDWDDSVPLDLQTRWLQYLDNLDNLKNIEISRHAVIKNATRVELHTFSDSSIRGYGACVYLRSFDEQMNVQVSLIAAKSRVAPINNKCTLPRLELCAAVVSAQLAAKFKSILNLTLDKEYYWCDSQITLCWLKSPPQKWKTYVANRVSEIQNLTNVDDWFYVKSGDNPADVLSRGISPSKLATCNLWWLGPSFLWTDKGHLNFDKYNNSADTECLPEYLNEKRKTPEIYSLTLINQQDYFIERFSSLQKLLRITAWCIRFKNNCKVSKEYRQSGTLKLNELSQALTCLLKLSQGRHFYNEIQDLHNNKALHSRSCILNLTPFLDDDGILRVGGRLKLSNFSYDKKHPIVLPKNDHLTYLIVQSEHLKLLHAGPKLLLASLREKYWPINGKCLCKKVVRMCMKCFRQTAKPVNPIMGDLPKYRLTAVYPFHSTGVDYAGPFLIKDRKGRGAKISKCYICLFVCLSTKAVHLELVSDLSTDAFIATFRRFVSRRGKPSHMFSDNGTNFVGASKELKNLQDFVNQNESIITDCMSQEGIVWHHIAPNFPNCGGLWEAGVKSCKHHLKRILTQTPLTFEDFATLLTQIEAVLNSRPITPLSDDPNDFEVLTPAHFLIGRSFSTTPDPDLSSIPLSRLNRYQHIQQMVGHFWKRWHKEYINQLQTRDKWKIQRKNMEVGQMVLIKDDNLPPANWRLGRIFEVYPGQDQVVRVAAVKTATSLVKRPVNKLCLLPIELN